MSCIFKLAGGKLLYTLHSLMEQQPAEKSRRRLRLKACGPGILLGICVGVALGVALGSYAEGIAIGVGVGFAFCLASGRPSK